MADKPPMRTAAAMLFPLFHNSLPVAPSRACKTALGEFETAKTTPLTTIGAIGAAISAEVQPACKAGESPSTFQAETAFFEGATIHRVPVWSCQLASAPETAAG